MDKRSLMESDICKKFILPAVKATLLQVREEEFITLGHITVRGELVALGTAKESDVILYCKPKTPIAVIEAKDTRHTDGDGLQQEISVDDSRRRRINAVLCEALAPSALENGEAAE